MFVMLSCLFIAALWSHAGKGLASWLSCVLCFVVLFFAFPSGVLGRVWFFIVSIPDLRLLTYVYYEFTEFACLYTSKTITSAIR